MGPLLATSCLGCGLTAAASTLLTRPCTVPLGLWSALVPTAAPVLRRQTIHRGQLSALIWAFRCPSFGHDLCDGCPLLGGLFSSLRWRCRAPRVGQGSNGDLWMLLTNQVPALWVKARLSAWHHRAGFVWQCCSGCCSIYVGRLVGPCPGAPAVAAVMKRGL
jgi:hypothetical protein